MYWQGSDDDDKRETTAERIRKKLRTEATSKDFLVDDGSSEDENKQKSETMSVCYFSADSAVQSELDKIRIHQMSLACRSVIDYATGLW